MVMGVMEDCDQGMCPGHTRKGIESNPPAGADLTCSPAGFAARWPCPDSEMLLAVHFQAVTARKAPLCLAGLAATALPANHRRLLTCVNSSYTDTQCGDASLEKPCWATHMLVLTQQGQNDACANPCTKWQQQQLVVVVKAA